MSDKKYRQIENRHIRRLIAWLFRQFIHDLNAIVRQARKGGGE